MKARAKFKEEVKQKLLEFLKESEEHESNTTNPQSDYIGRVLHLFQVEVLQNFHLLRISCTD